jgi:calcium-dependent protein kinase
VFQDIMYGTARRTGHSYSEEEVVRIITSVLRVTAQCHARNFIHRDIKPENFMFLDDSENSPIRAIDFGLSTAIKPGETLSDRCGTVRNLIVVSNRGYFFFEYVF